MSHDCPPSRSIGYYLEPLLLLGLFAKRPLFVTLRGVTNDHVDPGVDTFRTVTLPLLKVWVAGVPAGCSCATKAGQWLPGSIRRGDCRAVC